MKTKIILLTTVLIISLTSFKCTKSNVGSDCTGVVCTMVFATVSVHIEDRSANPVKLDVYTIRNSTGEKITPDQFLTDGNYIVLDDSYHLKIANKTETFTFIGMKGSTKVFSETYQIKADCCHVSKVSGKDSLIVP